MLKTIHIPESTLGGTVEIRELTIDGFLAAQKVADSDDSFETSMQYLSSMLYIDGQPVTREWLGQQAMSEVLPLINRMNDLFPGTDEGED